MTRTWPTPSVRPKHGSWKEAGCLWRRVIFPGCASAGSCRARACGTGPSTARGRAWLMEAVDRRSGLEGPADGVEVVYEELVDCREPLCALVRLEVAAARREAFDELLGNLVVARDLLDLRADALGDRGQSITV